jgi:hypothetical protein
MVDQKRDLITKMEVQYGNEAMEMKLKNVYGQKKKGSRFCPGIEKIF